MHRSPARLDAPGIVTVINEQSIGRTEPRHRRGGREDFPVCYVPQHPREEDETGRRGGKAKGADLGIGQRQGVRAARRSGWVAARTPQNCGNFVSRANDVMK